MKRQAFIDGLDRDQLFQSMHLIEQVLLDGRSNLGSDVLPSQEAIGLKVSQQLGYESGQFSDIQLGQGQKIEVLTNLIGLTGEHGVLPSHYSEMILQRVKNNDPTLKDFLDIFNHRLLSLLYRAWQSYQPHVQWQKNDQAAPSSWHQILSALTGDNGTMAIHFGGVFSRHIRSRGGVRAAIESLAGCKVTIVDFKGKWMNLSETEQTRLCAKRLPEGQYAELGNGASLGKRAWNVNAGVQIIFNAETELQVRGLLPKGPRIEAIKAMCQGMLGGAVAVEWLLMAQYKFLPKVQLNKQGGQLARGCVVTPHARTENSTITIRV